MEPLAPRQRGSKDGRLSCQSHIEEEGMCGEYRRCLLFGGGAHCERVCMCWETFRYYARVIRTEEDVNSIKTYFPYR